MRTWTEPVAGRLYQGQGGPRVWHSTLVNGRWQSPTCLTEAGYGEPTVTADGRRLYMVRITGSDGEIVYRERR